MGFQLSYREDFSHGLKRLIAEECKLVLETIRQAGDEQAKYDAVHFARTSFKKIRAALKLVRDTIDHYQEENEWFRDRGRVISDLRDASANLEILEQLSEQFKSREHARLFKKLRTELRVYRDELGARKLKKEKILEALETNLQQKIESVPGWPLQINGYSDIRSNLQRSYEQGQEDLDIVASKESPEEIHEFRKKAKYLRYQVDMLNRLWPSVMETLEKEFHRLTDFTGELNDLKNLQQAVRRMNSLLRPEESKMLGYLIENRQEYLLDQVIKLGSNLYAESPAAFGDRMGSYWENHQLVIKKDNSKREE